MARHVHHRGLASDHLGIPVAAPGARRQPAHAPWLNPSELESLSRQLKEEQRVLKPVANYREAFKSSVVIALSIQYFCWSVGVYGFVLWLPSILKAASKLGIVEVGWLSAVPYLVATVLMIVVLHFRSVRAPQAVRLAVFDLWRDRIRRLLRRRRIELLGGLHIVDHCRGRHLRAVWTVLRLVSETLPRNVAWRGDCVDQ